MGLNSMELDCSLFKGHSTVFFCHGRDHCDNKLLHNFKCMSECNKKQFKLKDVYTKQLNETKFV